MCALLRMLCQAGLAIVINPNDMRDGKKGWWRILHVSSLLSWKWLQTMESDIVNYQKRYLAICLKANTSCRFACKPLNAMWSIVVLSFSSPGPLLKRYIYIYIVRSTLSPKGFPQVFVCGVESTASRPHMACIRSIRQEPQYEPSIMNTDNCNLICIYIYILYIYIYVYYVRILYTFWLVYHHKYMPQTL